MERFCQACQLRVAAHFLCPKCGESTIELAEPLLTATAEAETETPPPPPPAFWLRLLAGLILAQGLYYGTRTLWNAYLLASGESLAFWAGLHGLVTAQVMQAVTVVLGGILAGAVQTRAMVAGSVLGVWNAVLILLGQYALGQPVTDLTLFGQPILHAFLGALGGLLGAQVWKPLEKVALPEEQQPPTVESQVPLAGAIIETLSLTSSARSAPIAWGRIVLGVLVAAGGAIGSQQIRDAALKLTANRAGMDTVQKQFVAWEIAMLAVLAGGVLAGSNTSAGVRQGCLSGGLAAFAVALFAVSRPNAPAAVQFLMTQCRIGAGPAVGLFALSSLIVAGAGGWFGGQLLPRTTSRQSLA